MAGKVISRFQSGSGIHLISSTFYGTCNTAADVAVKQVEINDEHVTELKLIPGMLLSVKFTNGNTAANPKLKIYAKGTVPFNENSLDNPLKNAASITPNILTGGAGEVILFVYGNNEQGISNYLSVSGGTLTGKLNIQDNNMNIATAPSSNQYSSVFEILDSSEKQIMNITDIHEVTGNYHGFSIGTYDSETGQQNTLQLSQNNNSGYKVGISQPAAGRSALSIGTIGTKNTLTASDIPSLPYLPTSGGTVSGGNVDVKSTNIADGTTPSSDTVGNARVLFSGSNGVNLGWVDVTNFSTGVQTIRLYARRVVNGATKYCGILLGLDSFGNPSVQLSSPAAWRDAVGVGTIGTKDTLTESDIPDNAANTSGNAGTATKLKTARSLYVSLGTTYSSTTPVTFDGSAAKALPVNGTLSIANGGTGKTTATEAGTALGGGAIGKKASLTASDLPTVPITKGGTGATTTANAQKALMGTADTDGAYLKGSANVTQYSRGRCKSGIVFVELYYTASAGLSTTNKNFGTIPTGYRPNKEVDVAAYLGQNVLHFATMGVDTGGNVIAKTADGTSNSIYCSLSYPL